MTNSKPQAQSKYLPAGMYDAPRVQRNEQGNIVAIRQRRYILKDAWQTIGGTIMRRVDVVNTNDGSIVAEDRLITHDYLEESCVPVDGGMSFAQAQALALDHEEATEDKDTL